MKNWNDALLVGHEMVDSQHKYMVSLLDEVDEIVLDIEEGHDKFDEITSLFGSLIEYTKKHFAEEEEMFDELDYVSAQFHKFEHKIIVKKLENLELGDVDEDQLTAIKIIKKDVLQLIFKHIVDVDMTYKPHLKK